MQLPFAVVLLVINMYSYNLEMCVFLSLQGVYSMYLREKLQENESTFLPDSFWKWILLSLS